MLCPIKVNSNTIELTVHTSCYCVLDLLCVTMPLKRAVASEQYHCYFRLNAIFMTIDQLLTIYQGVHITYFS